jgi:hypothetical protein
VAGPVRKIRAKGYEFGTLDEARVNFAKIT